MDFVYVINNDTNEYLQEFNSHLGLIRWTDNIRNAEKFTKSSYAHTFKKNVNKFYNRNIASTKTIHTNF